MKQAMLKISLRDRSRNTEIRRKTGVTQTAQRISWSSNGQAISLDEPTTAGKVLEGRPRIWRHSTVRSHTRWTDDLVKVDRRRWMQAAYEWREASVDCKKKMYIRCETPLSIILHRSCFILYLILSQAKSYTFTCLPLWTRFITMILKKFHFKIF